MPIVIVLFGATGDLVAKRIVPALFHLFRTGKLPTAFRIVGVSRRPISLDEFREKMKEAIRHRSQVTGHRLQMNGFLKLFSFHQLQFEHEDAYLTLAATLDPAANRLVYLAVPPEQYPTILANLARSSIVSKGSRGRSSRIPWSRIIVEKPFGMDAKHAEAMEKQLAEFVDESQIYRIDHYLAKDMLQNILNFRFSNKLFEDNWNARDIESIHIRLWEKVSVEHRGSLYDRIGALRDVGQNHLLQMLALVTMDRPASFSAEDVRTKRADILAALRIPTKTEIRRETSRAQYTGYRSIAGVRPHSDTETFCKVVAHLATSRWHGVPITMEAGKQMRETRKEILVQFRSPYRNSVLFTLEPEEGITIHFWSKKPGLDRDTERRAFDFVLRGASERTEAVAEHEKLLLDAIAGDQTLFVSTDEVRAMWRFIDPILDGWKKNIVPLAKYDPGVVP